MSSLIFNGNIYLPKGLVMSDPYSFSGVRSVVEKASDGTPQIWEDFDYGKAIDLVGTESVGAIKKYVLDQMYELSKAPNAIYPLYYYGQNIIVRFRNEDPPAVSGTPVYQNKPNQEPNDYYHSVVLKFMEV